MVSTLMVAGCGNGTSSESGLETESVQETETVLENETESDENFYTQDELEKVLNLDKDRYVLQKSKNIDVAVFSGGYNTDVIKSLSVDDSEVDWDTPGTYPITYTAKIDATAMDQFLAEAEKDTRETAAETEAASSKTGAESENISETASSDAVKDTEKSETESATEADTNADQESEKESKDIENLKEVTISSDVTVVDEETAAGLIEEEIPVLADDIKLYTGEEKETEDTQDTETETKETEEQVKETEPVKTADSGKGNTGSQGSTNNGNTTKPSEPEKQPEIKPSETQPPQTQAPETQPPQTQAPETQPPETQHTHTWVAQTTTVHHDAVTEQVWVQDSAAWDEDVYETRTICSCGADITNNVMLHYADGCTGSYSNQSIKTGSIHHDATGHYETKVIQQAYDETITTGYVCSGCGATK